MKKQSSLNAILISAMVTLLVVVGIGWAAVAMNWIHISSSPVGSRDAELDAKGSSLGKKGGDFICEVTISTPKDTLNSEPKVYNDMLIAGLEPEASTLPTALALKTRRLDRIRSTGRTAESGNNNLKSILRKLPFRNCNQGPARW